MHPRPISSKLRTTIASRATLATVSILATVGGLTVAASSSTAGSTPSSPSWTVQTPVVQTTGSFASNEFVSCPSTSFCMADWTAEVNQSGFATSRDDQIATWNPTTSGSWQTADIPSSVFPAPYTYAQIVGLSCLSATYCLAFGNLLDGNLADPAQPSYPLMALWNGSTWQLQNPELPLQPGQNGTVDAVSCTSSSFCMALGAIYPTTTNGLDGWGIVPETWNGSQWATAPVSLPGPEASSPSGVSCASPTTCGLEANVYGPSGSEAVDEIWNGSTWGDQVIGQSGGQSIHCESANFCLGGDGSLLWNGQTWAHETTSGLMTTACASAVFCLGIDQSAPTAAQDYSTFDGVSWTADVGTLALPTGANAIDSDQIACPSQSLCVMVGNQYLDYPNSLESGPLAEVWTNPVGMTTNRYVALGDSVPYGHGLANPNPVTLDGLPPDQPPSTLAYPSLVASALGYKLDVSSRSTLCSLTGDQLSVSGAPMSSKNVTGTWKDCSSPSPEPSVDPTEMNAANIAFNPPELVTIQAGADDINFAGCFEYALGLPRFLGGKKCSQGNSVTPTVAVQLSPVTHRSRQQSHRSSPNRMVLRKIAVVNYYQPIRPVRQLQI